MLKKVLIALALAIALFGCKHHDDEDWSGWQHVKLPDTNYDFYIADVNQSTDESTLYVFFPGFGGGCENEASRKVQRCLKKYGKKAILLAPRIDHKRYPEQTFALALQVVGSIQHGNTVLVGVSAGAVAAMQRSCDFGADAVLAAVAGAYRDAGGQPSDELATPCCKTWYLNGYDEDFLAKYKVHWDGVVFADPAIRAYESSPTGSKMTLLPGYVHQDAVKMMTDEAILWLDEDFAAVK